MRQVIKKSVFKKIFNFGVVFRYSRESLRIIMQGDAIKDKLTLSFFFFNAPWFLYKSLITGKPLREVEERNKFLITDIVIKNKTGKFSCGNNILTAYIADENYEKHLFPVFDQLKGTFIDVGAHIGKYAVMRALKTSASVIAIEPNKINYTFLLKNIRLNNLNNVVALNKAAYSETAKISFYNAGKGEGDHSIFKKNESWTETSVDAETLDNMVREICEEKITLIKIDAEGAEVHVIKGACEIIGRDHPLLLIEILRQNSHHLEEIGKMLSIFNYDPPVMLDSENYLFK